MTKPPRPSSGTLLPTRADRLPPGLRTGVAVAILGSLVFLALLPLVPVNLADECYPYAVAARLGDGERLYRDIELYAYVPGPFLVYRAAFDLAGESVATGRIASAILLALGLASWAVAARQVIPRWLVLMAVAVMILAPGPWHMGYLRLAHTAWLAAALMAARTGSRTTLGIAGALAGATLGLRVDAAIVGLAGTVLVAVLTAPEPTGWTVRSVRDRAAVTAAGWATGLGLVIVALAWTHHAGGFVRQLVNIPGRLIARSVELPRLAPPAISDVGFDLPHGIAATAWYATSAAGIVAVVVLTCRCLRRLSRRPRDAALNGLLAVTALGALPQFMWERPDTAHLLRQFPVVVLVVLAVVHATPNRGARRIAAGGVAAWIAVVATADLVRPWASPMTSLVQASRQVTLDNGVELRIGRRHWQADMLGEVLARTGPEDAVLAMPYAPGVNFICDRPFVSRHMYVFPHNLVTPASRRDLVATLHGDPPELVVLWPGVTISGRRDGLLSSWAPEIQSWVDGHTREVSRHGPISLRVPMAPTTAAALPTAGAPAGAGRPAGGRLGP